MTHVKLRGSDGKLIDYDGTLDAGDSVLAEGMAELVTSVLPQWSNGTQYIEGEHVVRLGRLYRLTRNLTSNNGNKPESTPADYNATGIVTVWRPFVDYVVDDYAREGQDVYTCISPHTSQPAQKPSTQPTLWTLV